MKRILILLSIISSVSYAQSSVETSLTSEQKARMTSKQRMQLKAFESLNVIDTDENRSYIFRNENWEKEFSDTEILAAQKRQQTIKNTNASWKEFDELSRPVDASSSKNTTLSAPSGNTEKSQVFYYETIDAKSFYQNGFSVKVPDGKQVCFVKVYFKNKPEFDDISLEGIKARKSFSEKVASFKYFENKPALINFEKNGINRISSDNNEILGILMAYTD